MRRTGRPVRIAAAMVSAIALLASTSAGAQHDYPSKPIRIIVPKTEMLKWATVVKASGIKPE